MAANETYADWQARMAKVILPKWIELPNFDLYGIILLLINETLQPLGADPDYCRKSIIMSNIK